WVANARKDFLHKTSTTKNHGAVVVEALPVRNMSASAIGTAQAPSRNVRAKAGLSRAILDQGWRALRIMLAYKLADRGARLLEVAAAYTSQTCAALSMPAAVAINRILFASRVVTRPMPPQMRRSTYCARTAR